MSTQKQTVLRVKTNLPDPNITGRTQYSFLDLYTDIPIKLNKSIAEIQDIGKRNSDLTIGLLLPGSKRNNRFFESFFNVDTQSLYFNATKRVECDALLNDQPFFRGYLKLNKVSVINSKVEYDVTLFSTVGDLFGKIGNNLLQDLDFDDPEYTFNHTFNYAAIGDLFANSNFFRDSKYPYPYFYPIVHNGYNYENVSGTTLPNVSGGTVQNRTRLYTPTTPISGWTTVSGATAAGAKEYYINSPASTDGIYDNQLKPGLNIYSLIQLIFKTYGYEVQSDFFNTPWFKGLYLYGYFSSELTKFSYKINNIDTLPIEGVELIFYTGATSNIVNVVVTKKGTGIPCYCLSDINYDAYWNTIIGFGYTSGTITAGFSGNTQTEFSGWTFSFGTSTQVPVAPASTLKYPPAAIGSSVLFGEGDEIDFNLVIDPNIKQIDLLSSIAKKFNLVFIPDQDYPNKIVVEPFDFFMGTGTIYDWTDKLSWDKGFTVEPALNYVESTLELTDLDDGDEGNREFKIRNNRTYGREIAYNPTDFKSQDKKIDTIFSPELIRQWDDNNIVGLPLGINYSAASQQLQNNNEIVWTYNGVKSKPKLFYWLMGLNPFIDSVGEVFTRGVYNTYTFKLLASTGGTNQGYDRVPTISHTMPMGLADENKINNDTISILFNSEYPVNIGVQTYNTYTENDCYTKFYNNRISNLYNPNTRYVSGYFNLKYSDVQNFKWNDIIKINEQHFIVNKINEFNLTNRELTKVDLIQFNVVPQQYPTRYFKYQYCDEPEYCFKIKTDFTNENLVDTNYIWSIYYDNQVGSLTGQTSGFTAAFVIYNTGTTRMEYIPYSMNEITETEYLTGTCYNYTEDTLLNNFYNDQANFVGAIKGFWESSGHTGVNVWNNCTDFYNTASTYGIITGSSQYYGPPIPITPTPTPTITPTPTPIPGCFVFGFMYVAPTPTPTPTLTPTPTPTPTPIPVPPMPSYMMILSSSGYYSFKMGDLDVIPGFFIYDPKTYISYDAGATWTEMGVIAGHTKISYGGQYVMMQSTNYQMRISSDYGASFVPKGINIMAKPTMDISDTGQYMVAQKYYDGEIPNAQFAKIYVSTNYGSSFYEATLNRPFATSLYDLRISGDGSKILALTNEFVGDYTRSFLFLSQDNGITWTKIYEDFQSLAFSSCAINYDGSVIALSRSISTNSNSTGIIYTYDLGFTWTASQWVDPNTFKPTSNQRLLLSVSGNYGRSANSTSINAFRNVSIAPIFLGGMSYANMNYDGQFQATMAGNSWGRYVMVSNDYGVTFTTRNMPRFAGGYACLSMNRYIP
jgi:hypothetical protein